MKPPKNFMTFPYNLFKKATIENECFENREYVINLKVEDTKLFKTIKKWLKFEVQE